MTKKDIILEFVLTDLQEVLSKNLDDYKFNEMYSLFENSKRGGQKFEDFLVETNAMKPNGTVRRDLDTEFYDKEIKKNIRVIVPFAYPIYSKINSKWNNLDQARREADKESMKNLMANPAG